MLETNDKKMKEFYPKIKIAKNINNSVIKNYDNKIENKNTIFQKRNEFNDIKIKEFKQIKVSMNEKMKKEKLFKTNRINSDKMIKANFHLNPIFDYQNLSLRNYISKDNIINDNNKLDENKKLVSHNIIINDLLMKTENFFNELGLHLDENNPEKKKTKKEKKNNIDFFEIIQHNNISNSSEKLTKKSNKLLNNDNDIIKEENNNTKKFKFIFENYSNINNNLNPKKISLKNNKSYNNINDINNVSNDSKMKKDNIKVYYKKKKTKKMVSDEIIQTFNILDNNEQKVKENKKRKEKEKVGVSPTINNNLQILPYLSPSSSAEILELDKNRIKIAEIKPVFPVYPYNRIIKYTPLNNNKFNYNIHKKFILDMKISHDNRYNYEQLMNKIKYEEKNKRENFKNNYYYNNFRYGQNSSDKNIFTNRRLYKNRGDIGLASP